MALADSGRAIGAITKLLREHLIRRGFAVSVGKPEQAAASDTAAKLNLFLYEIEFDASLRNIPLDEERPPPIWLVLKYLLTAFDADESSDSADAHELLGRGMSALHELNFLSLDAAVASDVRQALENNPESIKLTFDATPADLLAKIMQGTDEKYRLSVAFQVRPVLIVPSEPPAFALLVGIDSTETPPLVIGRDGIGLAVLATLGARLTSAVPDRFEPGETIQIFGDDLHLDGLECWLGPARLSIVGQRPDQLTVRVAMTRPSGAAVEPIAGGGVLSAGEQPLSVRRRLPNGRFRSSNLLVVGLRPIVTDAALDGTGALVVNGTLLGTVDDEILVAFYRDGTIVRVFESPTLAADQSQLTIPNVPVAVAPGLYQVIVRINGQQAKNSPGVNVS